ncbi:hypothetical protein ACWGIN_27275 [Streptomyces sp. NPDC054861]
MNKFRAASTVVATVALLGLAQSPAMAATDVTVYGPSWNSSCTYGSAGHFASYGETFTVYDKCADGWSAVLLVDVAPYKPAGGYDFVIWNPNGADGSPLTVNKSYAEGTGICMQAGGGDHVTGESGNFGNWACGVA